MHTPTSESLMYNPQVTSRLDQEAEKNKEIDPNHATVEQPKEEEKSVEVQNKVNIKVHEVIEEQEDEYDYFRVPADLEDAKKHGRVKKVFYEGSSSKPPLDESKVCQCCNLREGEKIPLSAGLKSIYHLGSGYPLYFKFIKYAIGMLLAMMTVSGLYNLISNVVEGDCSSQQTEAENVYCLKGYILSFSLPNKRDNKELLTAQLVLNLLTVVMIMVFFHFLRYQLRKVNVEADVQTLTPSDYTIELRNVPLTSTREEIVDWILKLDSRLRPQDIIRVHKTYAIRKLLKILSEKSALTVKQARLAQKKKQEESKGKRVDEELLKATENMNDLKKIDKIERTPLVYVTLRTSKQAEDFINDLNVKRSTSECLIGIFLPERNYPVIDFDGYLVRVRRAPEPTDILWENLEYSNEEKTRTWILSNAVILVIMIASFGIIFLVNWGQGKAVDKYGKGSSVVQGLSIVASLVIMMTNFILTKTVKYFTKYEKNLTYTHYLRGVTKKLAIALFLNTALTNLLAEIILADGDQDSLSDRVSNLNFYGKGGLLENMYWVFITNGILSPFIGLFDPYYFYRRLKQYRLERNEKQGIKNNLTQSQANTLYEGSLLDMPKKYAEIIKIMLLASFYAPALPFSIIFTIIGLVLWFWIDKYVMLRRMGLPKSISKDLTDTAVEYLEWAACTFAVGNIVYVYTLKNSVDELAFTDTARSLIWITLGISLFHIYFPMEMVNKRFLKVEKKGDDVDIDFEGAELKFNTDYDIEDPLTHASGLRRKKQLHLHSNTFSDASGLQLLKKGLSDNVTQFLNFDSSNVLQAPISARDERNQEDILDFRFLQAYARKVKANEQNMGNNNNNEDVVLGIENLFGGLYQKIKKGDTTSVPPVQEGDLENQSPENTNRNVSSQKIHPL